MAFENDHDHWIWAKFGQDMARRKKSMFPKEIWKCENSATKSLQQNLCNRGVGGNGSACDEGFNGGDGEAGGDSGSIGDYGDGGGSWHYTHLPHHRNHHNQLM